ncbi:MAG: dephospho-CoA kinase [Candidatus Delongbacteria bacterium]|nr:dephospho-CoA kinase [bacterium]MBL7033728.1 dephospho-CoA kinase [Candidatus Delongbacteria bacterium]
MKFAITGGIATGKTLVADMLREQGLLLLDADSLALDYISSSEELRGRISEEFGSESFSPEGRINRGWLASRVFADDSSLARYNAIYQPAWLKYLQNTLDAAEQQGTIGLDAALVAEWEIAPWFDIIILITTAPELRSARLQQSRGLSAEEARRRIDTQLDDRARRQIATEVICNDRSVEDLRREVKRLVRLITGASTRI